MQQAFSLFSWDRPFLPEVLKYICDISQNDLSRVTIIMPHSRPRRYLADLFYTYLPRPCFLPNMLTITEMVQLFQNVQDSYAITHGLREATELDAVYLLFKVISAMQRIEDDEHDEQYQFCNHDTLSALTQLDLAQFLPWGSRLYALFEECMQQLSPVQNMAHTEEEVSPVAAELLGALGDIYENYLAILAQEGFTTPALSTMRTVQALRENPSLIPPLLKSNAESNQHVFLIGFNVLTESDEVLLKALWQAGAHVCIHSDPALASSEKNANEHYSCEDHALWLRRWNAQCELVAEPSGNKAELHFIGAYDVHSQLLALQENLHKTYKRADGDILHNVENIDKTSSAVVLTSPSLLIPTLHHLPPHIDFNVSMGYPLEKSSLFAFIEILLRLQERARIGAVLAEITESTKSTKSAKSAKSMESDVLDELFGYDEEHINTSHCHAENESAHRYYYWRELLHALRHPYVQALRFSDEDGAFHSLQADIAVLEKILRTGKRYVSIEDLMHSWQFNASYMADSAPFMQELLKCIVHNFAKVSTAYELGDALYQLCQLLLRNCTEFLERHDIDAESMYRLVHKVIPQLKDSCLAHTPLPPMAVFALCRQFIGKERVAFEADPITGLQIIGMLETRLLHFENVFILDAIDSALPGFKPTDPLLPESLRPVLGLPGLQERERVVAYTLQCLLASAKNVHFYWQEGAPGSELLDSKKTRSRFVNSYLWEEECRRKRIIEKNEPPLYTVPCPLHPIEFESKGLKVSSQMTATIVSSLEKGISPSKLNTYLSCPQRFAWQYLYNFGELDEVTEGDDFLGVGKLLHEVLHEAFKPYLNQKLYLDELTLDYLLDVFHSKFSSNKLYDSLSPQNKMFLQKAVPMRLKAFLQAQKKQISTGYTHIKHLEEEFRAPIIGVGGERFQIKGTLDRVDMRTSHECNKVPHDGLVILDYKTGKKIEIKGGDEFKNMSLFDRLQDWNPDNVDEGDALLAEVSEAFPSLQLPCYLYLCLHRYGKDIEVLDAAFVSLANTGEEFYFLKNVEHADRGTIIGENIVKILTFVIRHLQCTRTIIPKRSGSCAHCPYGLLCQKTI